MFSFVLSMYVCALRACLLQCIFEGAEGTSRGPSSGALLRVSSESSEWIDAWARALLPRCQNAASGFAAPLNTPPLANHSSDLKHNKSKSLASLQSAHEPATAAASSTSHGSSPSLLSSQQQPPVSPSGAPPPVAYAVKRDGSKEHVQDDGEEEEKEDSGNGALAKEGEAPRKEVEPAEVPVVPIAEPPPPPRARGGFPASKPMHRCTQPSFLSAEESSKQNYRGLFNLAALILVVSNLRMFLKNFLVHPLFSMML